MAQAGLSTYQIAKVVDCNQSTVHRFLEKIRPDLQALQPYKEGRADILALLQAKNISIQERLLERLEDDGLLRALTPQQLSGIVFALNSQHGTLFDKERLERGQSSQNISVVSRMIDSAVQDIYKPMRNKGTGPSAPQSGATGVPSPADTEAPEAGQDSEAGETGGQGGL